ncbi:5-carboxymethyl-2-hydroxymuconate isomerase [Achromobacter xylosoxidans]|uniref:fumarylacetoacetate hydrolase family protein n=1 Tax=Alcaligenes xylosoxydans xylosoxydans TaxID=85698 RepID=UPI00076B2A1F|nr:fumarylacetoacetate hydrolase family protein [Achromobacter xylosoxidans]AMH05054.1 5-carboxymethyl-2-hydroxymuconate isomerase [Achromobacter xylosoxidans]
MKLVTFSCRGRYAIGKIDGTYVVDLNASDPLLPTTMLDLFNAGPSALGRAKNLSAEQGVVYPLSDVRLEAPISNPTKFLAIGLNYRKHALEAQEVGVKVPEAQVWFNKQVSCINGPFDPVYLPRVSEKLDYEAELGVIIGRRARNVSAAEARSVVAGYFICNDVTARDWQMASPTWTLGKSFNTHGPIGPWIVTADEIEDPQALSLRMKVNGEVRQEANTSEMIHSLWDQIEYLSKVMTLEPGDLLATGTPSGVGVAMKPPVFLKAGDVMRVEIDGIGHIENVVVAEPA